MARTWLPDVSLGITWTTLVGALDGVLRSLGESRPAHDLMGITGFAFRLALTREGGVLAAAPAAAALDLRRALPLLENAGRALEVFTAAADAADFADVRARALAAVRRSIDRGRPSIAYDIHLPEFGIIHGYDDRARTLAVSSLMSGQYGRTLAESRWPVPERGGRLIVLVPGARRAVPDARAHHAALEFALAYAQQGDPGDPTGAAHGLAAFAAWRETFERGLPLDPPGNARAVQTVQAARLDAARFLRAIAPAYPDAAAPLARAASAHERGALAFSRMATVFPYPSGGDVESAAGRLVALGALREAEAQEQAALEAIVEGLPAIAAAAERAPARRSLVSRLFRA